MILLPLLSLSLLACEPAGSVPSPPPAAVSGQAATDTVVVDGRTVLAFFAVTEDEVDADADLGEVLSDFQHYLPGVREELKGQGIVLFESYADTIVVMRGGRTERFLPRTREVPVGYVLYAPGRPPHVLEGVMTDVDLLDAARARFGLRGDAAGHERERAGTR